MFVIPEAGDAGVRKIPTEVGKVANCLRATTFVPVIVLQFRLLSSSRLLLQQLFYSTHSAPHFSFLCLLASSAPTWPPARNAYIVFVGKPEGKRA